MSAPRQFLWPAIAPWRSSRRTGGQACDMMAGIRSLVQRYDSAITFLYQQEKCLRAKVLLIWNISHWFSSVYSPDLLPLLRCPSVAPCCFSLCLFLLMHICRMRHDTLYLGPLRTFLCCASCTRAACQLCARRSTVRAGATWHSRSTSAAGCMRWRGSRWAAGLDKGDPELKHQDMYCVEDQYCCG